ncbi:MAG: DHH family phosphoesterase, partial [Oscillospiraceae bacterium]|nr:DHH family phosphoesterase [Oscillospiraceae bacterium]
MKFENWIVRGFDRDSAVNLVRNGFNPLVAVILASRGFTTTEEAAPMLSDDLSNLYDPFLLRDMDKAVARIKQAIDNHERVVVFGDYDVDGMTSSCIMYEFLTSLGLECGVYIPGRLDEGYGLNIPAIDCLAEHGTSLIVTVDCGITAVEETLHAKKLGIDVIITDHHECKAELPDAIAVIDPKREDCTYPNRNLAGVGVAFKVICALAGKDRVSEMLEKYSEFVALGTIADVVSVRGENRTLIRTGINYLSKTTRPGLLHLFKETGLDSKRLTTGSIGFAIAPRLNAAGRMGCPDLSVRLLTTSDPKEAEK